MLTQVNFPRGYLQRQIDRRSLSQSDFARIAGVSADTVFRACKGEVLTKQTYGKIRVALAVVPALKPLRIKAPA